MEGQPMYSDEQAVVAASMVNAKTLSAGNSAASDEQLTWRKPGPSSGSHGACLEFASNGTALVGLRDSKQPQGGVLWGEVAMRGLVAFARPSEAL